MAVDAANAFLATLDSRQRARVTLSLNATTRTVWTLAIGRFPDALRRRVNREMA
jgi:predicted secreted protein